MLKASQIATIINEVFDGVERSKLGPIIKRIEIDGKEKFEINNLPYQTYIHIIDAVFPKNIDFEVRENK